MSAPCRCGLNRQPCGSGFRGHRTGAASARGSIPRRRPQWPRRPRVRTRAAHGRRALLPLGLASRRCVRRNHRWVENGGLSRLWCPVGLLVRLGRRGGHSPHGRANTSYGRLHIQPGAVLDVMNAIPPRAVVQSRMHRAVGGSLMLLHTSRAGRRGASTTSRSVVRSTGGSWWPPAAAPGTQPGRWRRPRSDVGRTPAPGARGTGGDPGEVAQIFSDLLAQGGLKRACRGYGSTSTGRRL